MKILALMYVKEREKKREEHKRKREGKIKKWQVATLNFMFTSLQVCSSHGNQLLRTQQLILIYTHVTFSNTVYSHHSSLSRLMKTLTRVLDKDDIGR